MRIEKTRLKLQELPHGELVGLVYRSPKNGKLYGVRSESHLGRLVCVISDHLQGSLKANILYDVSVIPMRSGTGYVIIDAERVKFKAHVVVNIVPKRVYRIEIVFGNKTIFFDPLCGRAYTSTSLDGVIELLEHRADIANKEETLQTFVKEAGRLLDRMIKDGVQSRYSTKH